MPTARLGHRRGKHTDSDAPAYDKAGAQTKTLAHSDAPDDDLAEPGKAIGQARPSTAKPVQDRAGMVRKRNCALLFRFKMEAFTPPATL